MIAAKCPTARLRFALPIGMLGLMSLIAGPAAAAAPQCGPGNIGQLACLERSVCRCENFQGGTMLRDPPGYRWNCNILYGACTGEWMSGIPAPGPLAPGVASGPISLSPDDVRAVQRGLKAQGFDPGPLDGVAGPRTRNAITAFQRKSGMAVTGDITPDLVGALARP